MALHKWVVIASDTCAHGVIGFHLYKTRATMRKAANKLISKKCEPLPKEALACCVWEETPKASDPPLIHIFMSRECCDIETLAHESVHAAVKLIAYYHGLGWSMEEHEETLACTSEEIISVFKEFVAPCSPSN